ncbi:MAG: hypothetical protein R3B71_03810 [Candidatus Gracilibacteria bacterium]
MQNKKHTWLKKAINTLVLTMMVTSSATAQAAILFQDDDFHDIASDAILIDFDGSGANDTAIQFGNDAVATENGTINWNITTNTFEFDNSVEVTGDLSADGDVDFSAATQTRLREDTDPNTNADCAVIGELIVDTTDEELQICTTPGSPGVWAPVVAASTDADTLDGLDSLQFLRSDTSDNFTSGTLTTDAGTTLDVNGVADFSGATRFAMAAGAADPGTCTEGDLFYNTTTNELRVCTATDTWSTGGPQDFEDVYGADADNTLTTSNGDFNIATGTGEFDVTSTGLIDFNADSFDIDLTGGFFVNAGAASNITTSAGALTLEATTDDVNITAGDDIVFDDAQLTAPVTLTEADTGIDATFGTTGIIDALNSLTSTATGEGASNVGIEDAGGYYTGADVEAALQELGAVSGSNAPNNEVLTFYPEYPDATIFQDGSNNKGKLEALYDDANSEHYYSWTTKKNSAQDIDIRFRFPLPADFLDVNDFTYRYRTGSTTEADNDVEVTVVNVTDAATCGSDTTNGSANVWATGTIAEATLEAGCTGGSALDAGDIIEIAVKLIDATNAAATFADIGFLSLGYDN